MTRRYYVAINVRRELQRALRILRRIEAHLYHQEAHQRRVVTKAAERAADATARDKRVPDNLRPRQLRQPPSS